jgi:hypothetical protein
VLYFLAVQRDTGFGLREACFELGQCRIRGVAVRSGRDRDGWLIRAPQAGP